MKRKTLLSFCLYMGGIFFAHQLSAQTNDIEKTLRTSKNVSRFEMNKTLGSPSFIGFKKGSGLAAAKTEEVIRESFALKAQNEQLLLTSTTLLKSGIEVRKYQMLYKGIPVEHSAYIVNIKDGEIISITAESYKINESISVAPALNEAAGLQKALAFVNANKYAWQSLEEDKAKMTDAATIQKLEQMRQEYYPKGKLVFAKDVYGTGQARLTWKFDVYATEPVSRHNIYVDAETGKIILADAIIKHAGKTNPGEKKQTAAPAPIPVPQIKRELNIPPAPPVSVVGTAQTRYAGTRNIYTTRLTVPITGATDPNNTSALLTYSGEDPRTLVFNTNVYILKDDTRGGGIETYDMNALGGAPVSLPALHGTSLAFVDLDNNWKNETAAGTHEDHVRGTTSNGTLGPDEAANDDYALDAHWGAAMVYDYWKARHGRLSYDNLNSSIKSYVHYGPAYDNAFWNGSVMTYGDGSGTTAAGFRPLTSLDVCGHEIGHGVCSFTSNLVYASESGAMNEGLSDIWAAAIENFANTPPLSYGLPYQPFQIGEQISADNIGLRRMDDPKNNSNPDTYGGRYWTNPVCTPTLANDQCGVHSNSGVLNKYFYLLVNGPSATTGSPAYTDDGKADGGTATALENLGNIYAGAGSPIPSGEFIGLGFLKAEAITYLMELNLTPNSTYADARVAAINAARVLYGECSQEEKTVTDAWFAVNVGANYSGCSAPLLDANLVRTIINEETADTLCPRFTEYTITVNLTAPQASPVTINFSRTGGTLGSNEYEFVTDSVKYNTGETGAKQIRIRIYDDALVEGDETLEITAAAASPAFNKVITLTVQDNDVVPTIGGVVSLLNENFESYTEGAIPTSGSGWVQIAQTTPINVQWAVRTDGTLPTPIIYSTKRAIIEMTAPVPLPGEALYDQATTGSTILRSPMITATGLANLKAAFKYQAGGEPACSPACDYGQLMYSLDGTTFSIFTDAPPLYLTLNETVFEYNIPPSLNGKIFYLGVLWYNDANGGASASLALDSFVVTGAGKRIESTVNASVTEPVNDEPFKAHYFYSNTDKDIIASLNNVTAHNYGCTQAKVEKQGTGAFTLYTTAALAHKVSDKVISITPTNNNASGAYEVTLYYTEAEIAGLEASTGASRTQFSMYKITGAPYTAADASNTSSVLTTYTAVNGGGKFAASFSTGFSSFSIGYAVSLVLPVTLRDFNATVNNCKTNVQWTVATETNMRYYEVERSGNGSSFTTLATVTAMNRPDGSYQFTDNQPLRGSNYYRLKMVDINGTVTYSVTRSVNLTCGKAIEMYPNITPNYTVVRNLNGGELIRVITLQGQLLMTVQATSSNQMINVEKLPAGEYYITVTDNDRKLFTGKLTKVR